MTDYIETAELRVARSPQLNRLRDVILYDWPEGDAHWQWVATAPAAEIVDWAETVAVDAEPEDDPDLSTGAVAQLLGVDRRTVTGWCIAGRVTARRTPGGHWRIPASVAVSLG